MFKTEEQKATLKNGHWEAEQQKPRNLSPLLMNALSLTHIVSFVSHTCMSCAWIQFASL